ncbi:MAG: alanine racemase [Gammaproteobacteria bacterium]|nr:alanine racemase [Gammaproteobacteria bacterium]
MSRPTYALIDTAAFVANYRLARSLAPGARALAVVKANAYGHGAVALARALGDEADAFGVACTEEAMELRESGIGNPILLMEGPFEPAEITNAALHGLDLVIHAQHQLDWLLAARIAAPLTVWLKVDTGMHRLGLEPDRLPDALANLEGSPNVGEVVLMSHLACADEPGHAMNRRQQATFENCGQLPVASLANSAAVLSRPTAHRQWVRPGIMLYGSSPVTGRHPDLRAVMTFESRLIAIHELAAGESIGYGGRFRCDAATRVGVVAAGYADGYPRHAPDGTPVSINGQRSRLIGRVSMDMLTVDLSDQPHAAVGDRVQLWGEQVLADEVAAASGTIAYELFTRMNRRVHYRYS